MSGETAEIVALDESRDPVAEVAGPEFGDLLRGYDRAAVDEYVRRAVELVAELHATSSPRAAVRRALDRVGEQTTAILQEAQRSADELTAQSRAQADERIKEGEREAARLVADAELRVRELDQDTEALWRERMRLIDNTRAVAAQLVNVAEQATQAFPPEPAPEPEPPTEDEAAGPPTEPLGSGDEPDETAESQPDETSKDDTADKPDANGRNGGEVAKSKERDRA